MTVPAWEVQGWPGRAPGGPGWAQSCLQHKPQVSTQGSPVSLVTGVQPAPEPHSTDPLSWAPQLCEPSSSGPGTPGKAKAKQSCGVRGRGSRGQELSARAQEGQDTEGAKDPKGSLLDS